MTNGRACRPARWCVRAGSGAVRRRARRYSARSGRGSRDRTRWASKRSHISASRPHRQRACSRVTFKPGISRYSDRIRCASCSNRGLTSICSVSSGACGAVSSGTDAAPGERVQERAMATSGGAINRNAVRYGDNGVEGPFGGTATAVCSRGRASVQQTFRVAPPCEILGRAGDCGIGPRAVPRHAGSLLRPRRAASSRGRSERAAGTSGRSLLAPLRAAVRQSAHLHPAVCPRVRPWRLAVTRARTAGRSTRSRLRSSCCSNASLGLYQEHRSEAALARSGGWRRRRPGCFATASSSAWRRTDIVPGDWVRLEAGDRLPADGRVRSARGAMVDESMLTGESLPVDKGDDDEAFSGTLLVRGTTFVEVSRTGSSSAMGRLAHDAR